MFILGVTIPMFYCMLVIVYLSIYVYKMKFYLNTELILLFFYIFIFIILNWLQGIRCSEIRVLVIWYICSLIFHPEVDIKTCLDMMNAIYNFSNLFLLNLDLLFCFACVCLFFVVVLKTALFIFLAASHPNYNI